MVEYTCAAEKGLTCDPLEGKMCSGNKICNMSNKPGLCIDPDVATEQINSGQLQEIVVNGKRIVGTKAALDALRSKLIKTSPSRSPSPQPPSPKSPSKPPSPP